MGNLQKGCAQPQEVRAIFQAFFWAAVLVLSRFLGGEFKAELNITSLPAQIRTG